MAAHRRRTRAGRPTRRPTSSQAWSSRSQHIDGRVHHSSASIGVVIDLDRTAWVVDSSRLGIAAVIASSQRPADRARRHARRRCRPVGVRRLPAGRGGLRPRPTGVARRRQYSATHSSARCGPRPNKNIGVYAVRYPADTEIDVGANDMSAAHPEHDQQLPGHPAGAGRLLAGRGGHRRGARGPVRLLRVQQSAAAGRGSAHRRGRPVRQRHRSGPGPSRTSTRCTASGPSSCATAPTRSATRPTRTPGKTTGPTTSPTRTSRPAWSNQAADFVAGRI